MSPAKPIPPVRPGVRKKASGPVASKRARGQAPFNLACPIVGGIALIGLIASILYLRGKT